MNNLFKGKRNTLSLWIVSIVVVMLIFGLTGCGNNNSDEASYSNSKSNMAVNDSPTSSEAASREQNFATEGEAAPAMDNSSPQETPQAPAVDSDDSSLGAVATDFSAYNRKLIYSANVVLEVEDYGDAQIKLNNMVTLSGGYMLNFNDVQSQYESGGVFVIKVPSKGFHPFVTKLEELKKKDTKAERNIQGNDVTEEYVDIESRLKAKQVVEGRLLDFMDKATDTKNLLQFSNQLAIVQEEIEAIKGRMRYINQNVAFSTVEIRLYEREGKSIAQEEKEDHVLTRAGDAMKSSGKAVLAMLEGTLIVMAGALPILIAIGIIAMLIWFIYRKTRYTGTHEHKAAYVTPIVHKEVLVPKEEMNKEGTESVKVNKPENKPDKEQ